MVVERKRRFECLQRDRVGERLRRVVVACLGNDLRQQAHVLRVDSHTGNAHGSTVQVGAEPGGRGHVDFMTG